MALDSMDLTFVRCPSCRSLVPAISTRCRMCGATLEVSGSEAGAATASSTAAGASSSTTSSSSPVMQMGMGDEGSAAPQLTPGVQAAEEQSAVAAHEDPLSAYVEEVDLGEQKPTATPAPAMESAPGSAAPVARAEESKVAAKQIQPSDSGTTARTERNGGPREERRFEARRNPNERRYQNTQSGSPQASGARQQTAPTARASSPSGAAMQASQPARTGGAASHTAVPRELSAASQDDQTRALGAGRLVGWLVSFADPAGSSREVREGKCFVTSKSLKERDFVISDRSIATPHALLSMSSETGLVVQDLMSERGVFVRSVGDSQYRQEEEATPLGHGDWVRFGDIEFQIVLLPDIGEG